jgi:hypothetical protein
MTMAHKTRKPDEKIVITRRLECVEVQIDGHLARRRVDPREGSPT